MVLNIALHLPLNGSGGAVAFGEGNYFCFAQPEFAKLGKADLPLCFAVVLFPLVSPLFVQIVHVQMRVIVGGCWVLFCKKEILFLGKTSSKQGTDL